MGGKKNEFGEVLKLCPSEEKYVKMIRKKAIRWSKFSKDLCVYLCACVCVHVNEELSISLSWCLRGGQRPLSVSAIHPAPD